MYAAVTAAASTHLWPAQQPHHAVTTPCCALRSWLPAHHGGLYPPRAMHCPAGTLSPASTAPSHSSDPFTARLDPRHMHPSASHSSQDEPSPSASKPSSVPSSLNASSISFLQPGWSQPTSARSLDESPSPNRFSVIFEDIDDAASAAEDSASAQPTADVSISHPSSAGHVAESAGHVAESAGHVAESAGHAAESALSQTAIPTSPVGSIEQLVAATGPYSTNGLSHGRPALSPDDAASEQLSSLFLQPEETISTMSPEQYANTLTIVSHLGIQLPRPVLPALSKATTILAPVMTGAHLSQTMYAFSAKKFALSPVQLTAIFKRAHSLLSQGAFPLHLCASFLCSCVQQQELVSKNGRGWDPKEGYITTKIRARFLGLVSKALTQQFDTLAPTDVARGVWALSRLGRHSQPLLDATVKALHANTAAFSIRELCQLLNAFRLARHHPQDLLPKIVAVLASQSGTLSAADISCCLQACALFNSAPSEELMLPLLARLMQLLPELSIRDVCVSLWCLGLMGLVRLPVFGELWDRMQELNQLKPLSGIDARQACQANISARLQGMVLTTQPLLLDSLRTAWQEQVQQSEGGGEASSYVSALLRRLGVRHEPRRLTKDGFSSIHIALQPRSDKFIALQLLSVGDVASNSGQLLGPALWQRDLMQHSGWQVQFLKVADFKSITPPLQPLFLAELCMSLGYSIEMPSPQETATWSEVKRWQSGQWRKPPISRAAGGRGDNAGTRRRQSGEKSRGKAEGDKPVRRQQGDEDSKGGDVGGLSEEEDFVQQLTKQLQAQQEPDLMSDLVEDDRRAQAARAAKQQQQKFRRMHGR